MSLDLTSKIMLVTGGGSGIGFELTRQLVALGNTVIICGRDGDKLADAARRTGAQAVVTDVTSADDQARSRLRGSWFSSDRKLSWKKLLEHAPGDRHDPTGISGGAAYPVTR